METWSGCIPPWWRPSRIWRAMPDALIPNEIDRRDARSWVSNPALKMMTQSSLRRPLKYLPMKLEYTKLMVEASSRIYTSTRTLELFQEIADAISNIAHAIAFAAASDEEDFR